MKVLVIGRDPNLFNERSETFKRIKEYASLFGALHIVVMMPTGFSPRSYDSRLFLWPTNSFAIPLRLVDATLIGVKLAKRYKIDVIDAQDAGEAGLASWIVARLTHTPFRLQIHTDVLNPYFRHASWKEYIRYLLARFLTPRADCIRTVSKRIKNSLIPMFQTKSGTNARLSLEQIKVLPIFTDISKYLNAAKNPETEDRFKDYEFKMIAVGRFVDKEKNFRMLIEVMRDFVKICPKALLVLVGDGPDRENYKLQVTNYKLDRNIVIEPWRDDLPSFYKSFDVYLMSSNYEGWGRTVIEAMAAGVPVIMTDVGLAGEVVENGRSGLVVSVRDQAAFLAAMKDLYLNPLGRKQLAETALNRVRDLYPKTKEEYLVLYKDSFKGCVSLP